MTQRSLFDVLEPIDPYGYVDRLPGADAPCICDPDRPTTCLWPLCPWPDHQPTEEDA